MIDLHVHTSASDGLYTPRQVIELALAKGLRTIAITDHDTVGGVAEAVAAAEGTGLAVIPGVEISSDMGGYEVHLLGYLVDYANSDFRDALVAFRRSRTERAIDMVAKLRALGVELSWDRVQELSDGGAIGRPHLAQALLEGGHVQSTQEAFDRYLGRGRPAFVARSKVSPGQALGLIRDARGVPVLAHPWGATVFVSGLVNDGLAGLEVYYAGYAPDQVARLERLARRHGLVCTGGSDFHGEALLPDNHLGGVKVPPACLAALYQRAERLAAS
ncbi:MAG: PHP domain-containing protein [Anaerolineae bacterium]